MRLQLRLFVLVSVSAACGLAQFSSGSTGTDGALSYTTPGTYNFNPTVLGLDPSGDNVFNFTTINIAVGVTLNLTSTMVRGLPVIWLASGAVTIAGTLNLSGANGITVNTANPWQTHTPAEPGPGGFYGGLGAVNFAGTASATGGFGPGAPLAPVTGVLTYLGAGAAYATAGLGNSDFYNATTGTIYGNASLNPLIGGSGGNGASTLASGNCCTIGDGNGGAGGGAIRIISSASIQISGSILANGGNGGAPDTSGNQLYATYDTGGGGSGGAVHLIAPTISGAGTISANGGTRAGSYSGGLGRILLSANANTFSGTLTGLSNSSALYVPTPIPSPSVTITSVNGMAAPANPGGNLLIPDVSIVASAPVTVAITATYVPIGTVVTLTLLPETAAGVTANCTPLVGTIASSTGTCSITFPSGSSLASARATW